MKELRKFAALTLVSAAVITGCAAQKGSGSVQRSTTSSDESNDPVTFVFYNADGVSDPWTDPVAQKITEATGVTLQTEFPSDAGRDSVDLMIADGDYPDLIFAKNDVSSLVDAGALLDLTDLIDEYGPNIKKLYGDDLKKLRYSESDSSIYQLCSYQADEDVLETSGTAQLQWAVLKNSDYKIPYTLADYENEICDYMEQNPEIGGQPTIGISICVTDWHWFITLANPAAYIADGSQDNGQWLIADDGTTTYAPGSESEREYFRWLNRMYHEGILDPDFATQTHDDYMKKIADGRVLGLLDADWDYSDSEMKLEDRDEYDRTYAGLPVTIDDSVTCRIAYRQGLAAGWGIGITKACKDPVRAIKFLDWMCSDEAQVLTHWGIEGVNYYVDDNGKRCRTDEEIKNSENDAGYRAETGVGFHTYPFPSYGEGVEDSTGNTYQLINRDSVISSYNVEQKAALKAWGVDMLTDIFPQDDSSEEPTHAPGGEITLGTELSELKNTLDEIARQGLINCILCDESDFDAQYNKLETDLANAGAEKAGEMMTETVQSEMKLWAEN